MSPSSEVHQLRHDSQREYAAWLHRQVPERFRSDVIPPDPEGLYSFPPCLVPECERVAVRMPERLCRPHSAQRRQRAAHLPVAQFVRQARPSPVSGRSRDGDDARGIFRMSLASKPVVRSELALGLSLRAQGHGAPLRASAFNALARGMDELGFHSILEVGHGTVLREKLADSCGSRASALALLDQVALAIRNARGDDNVRISLGKRRGGSNRYSAHQDIVQPWLRNLVRRWSQYRLNTEAASPQHAGQQESMVVTFAQWCEGQDVTCPADLTRPLLLRWLGHVQSMTNPKTGKKLSGTYRAKFVSAIENFVAVVRAEFDASVPANAVYLRGERPNRDVATPRFLEPRIIDTLRARESLALIEDPGHRLAILIMMHVGLRAGHTCSLPLDCLLDLNTGDSNDKWALTFVDTKSNRNITLPIGPEVATAIRQHQATLRRTAEEVGAMMPTQLFPNPRAYRTGQLAPETINVTIARWVAKLDLREASGSLVNVTPHRFRHTFATEMLERGVPIDVVRELLGHRSLASTQVYATVTDRRLRSEWEKARVVNVRGESVALPTGGAGDAEWLLHRIGKAVQPLSNGWCGLPIQQTCPHANACLDCDHFMTSKEFLPVLRQQHDEHARFVSKAEREGHLRIAEINQRPMRNLERIIAAVEKDESCQPEKSAKPRCA